MLVHDFYKDCEVFVTGGSGVVGKALIEKLLRSCDVRKIYVLMRPKRNIPIEKRLNKIRAAKIFQRLHKEKPNEMEKLVAIPGDAAEPNLGITPEYALMLQNVSVVFHCAATVRFDEPIREALHLNVGATLEVLKMAENLKQLKVFMHVSTFFSNPYLTYVDSKMYSSPMDWRLCLELLKDDSKQDMLDALTKKMIVGFPNTYTFTKNLAESLVYDFRHRLPVAIYRPSIVLFSMRDPEPAFPTALMGAVGLFALVAAGILKTVYLNDKVFLDITPQDIGVKSMLMYTMKAAKQHKESGSEVVPVYMTSSSKHLSFTFKQMSVQMEKGKLWYKVALEKNFLLPSCWYTSSRLTYMFLVFTKQVLPALLGDGLIVLFGRKPILMSIARKAYNTLEVMQPFLFNNYECPGITDEQELIEMGRGTDFEVDVSVDSIHTAADLERMETRMMEQIRKVLLHEDPSTIPRARMILKIKSFAYNVVRAILAYYLLRWFYRYLVGYLDL